jgi:hypothetical protein
LLSRREYHHADLEELLFGQTSSNVKPDKDKQAFGNIHDRAGIALPDFVVNPSVEWLSRRTLTSGATVLREDVLELSRQATDAMAAATVVMIDDQVGQSKALNLLERALRNLKDKEISQEDFRTAEQQIRAAAVLIERDRQSQRNARKYTILGGLIALVQISLIATYIYFVPGPHDRILDGFAVPKASITFAAVGSLASVLFRFYTVPEKKFVSEIRRLIARPILGVILGVATYLAFTHGLLIVSNISFKSVETDNVKASSFLYLIAFLGGFSERWTNTLINSLLSKLWNLDNTTRAKKPDE